MRLMARRRVRQAVRKGEASEARTIAQGVYTIALDLHGQQLPLPVYTTAPLIYVCEMLAAALCRREPTLKDRHDDVSRYLMAALNEFAVALVESLDVDHFEEWIAAAERQDERGEGASG